MKFNRALMFHQRRQTATVNKQISTEIDARVSGASALLCLVRVSHVCAGREP